MTHPAVKPRRALAFGATLATIALAVAFVVTGPSPAAANGQIQHLPLSDFIDAQATGDVWYPPEPALFGHHVHDVAAGATPALGSANFKATWRQSADEPIADINLAQNYCSGWDDDGSCLGWPARPDGYQMLDADMRGTASGPLHAAAGLGPDGTAGKLVISQTNSNPQAFGHGQGGNGWGFPAEVVDLRVVGQ
jgi:hypothetical protein